MAITLITTNGIKTSVYTIIALHISGFAPVKRGILIASAYRLWENPDGRIISAQLKTVFLLVITLGLDD